jgi:hypothetical protein
VNTAKEYRFSGNEPGLSADQELDGSDQVLDRAHALYRLSPDHGIDLLFGN